MTAEDPYTIQGPSLENIAPLKLGMSRKCEQRGHRFHDFNNFKSISCRMFCFVLVVCYVW